MKRTKLVLVNGFDSPVDELRRCAFNGALWATCWAECTKTGFYITDFTEWSKEDRRRTLETKRKYSPAARYVLINMEKNEGFALEYKVQEL